MSASPPLPRIAGRALFAAALVALAAWIVTERRAGPQVDAVRATRADITQTVVATGRTVTPARLEVGPVILGTVTRVEVGDGQRVAAGDLLFVLDDREARAAVAQAATGVTQAQARVEQLADVGVPVSDQALRQAEANLELAEREMKRTQALVAQGFVSQARADEAARALATARAQRESALAQARANQPRGAEHRLALANLEAARAAESVARARLAHTVVRAPADGVIVRRSVEAGNVLPAGRSVIEIARDGETQMVAQIDEKNLALVSPGQRAAAAADAFPGQPFEAELFYVNPSVDPQRGTVEIKLRVAAPPAFLRPDMTVSIEIRVARKDGALTLPAEAVRDLAGQPWVMKVVDGVARRQPVMVGVRGTDRVEVTGGVGADEPVLAPAAQVSDGQRVRLRLPGGA